MIIRKPPPSFQDEIDRSVRKGRRLIGKTMFRRPGMVRLMYSFDEMIGVLSNGIEGVVLGYQRRWMGRET